MDVILDRGSTPLTSRKKDPLCVGLFFGGEVYETVRIYTENRALARPVFKFGLSEP